MIKAIESPIGEIRLRPQRLEDIPFLEAYLFDSDPQFLESIGFNAKAFNDRQSFRARMESRIKKQRKDEIPTTVIAEYQGRAISHTWLEKNREYSNAHFHIYEEDFRGKGLGPIIFKTALSLLMDAHGVDQVYVEPKDTNQRMIRLLEKCGFINEGVSQYKNPQVGEIDCLRFAVVL